MDAQAKQNTCCFYKSVQVFISRCGNNYLVLEGGPIVFYFPEAPFSANHLFKKKKKGGGSGRNKKENTPKGHYAKLIKTSLILQRAV